MKKKTNHYICKKDKQLKNLLCPKDFLKSTADYDLRDEYDY